MGTPWREIKDEFSAEQREEIRLQALEDLERIGFGKLRRARQQTQVALAKELNIPQGAVSRLERRTDLLLSTLRHYVEALGGELELRVVFPDGVFLIDSFGENAEAPSKAETQPSERSDAVA